jgi:hypothetical protein
LFAMCVSCGVAGSLLHAVAHQGIAQKEIALDDMEMQTLAPSNPV